MNIYISGISGTGLGPLALMAKNAGLNVFGSDLAEGSITPELKNAKINFKVGPQNGKYLEKLHNSEKIDWFVYTSALPVNHPELLLAKKLNIKTSKRDEFINFLIKKQNLKLIAVAGTHGKTTTTSMLIWCCLKLNIPISYLVGTTLPFAPSGSYSKNSEYFIYEADEYDRNFLNFHPWLSLITTVSYDHPDIYKTKQEYQEAFAKFEAQSENVLKITKGEIDSRLTLPGEARRFDATLTKKALEIISNNTPETELIKILNTFPGSGRRFEKLTDGIYSDYGHHPEEIAATIKIALEEAANTSKKGVVVIYEPHQNSRQHEVFKNYKDAFLGSSKVFWLPTFLTRENPNLKILKPEDFIEALTNKEIAQPAELDEKLLERLKNLQKENYLILLLTAGPADTWLRKNFT